MSADTVEIVRTTRELRGIVKAWRAAGETVALVPTMGALHAGHLSLAEEGLKRCSRAVMSIFVNPAQFAPNEDLDAYPRTFESDVEKFAAVGGHLIWAPTVAEMYPDGFATKVIPAGAALGLETDFRPQFFAGVATVCLKLFTQTLPDIALFGEKDYQQLCVVRQMVRDLDLPLEIVGCPTIREADGLAMSSRNAYLGADERVRARVLHKVLRDVAHVVDAGHGTLEGTAQAIDAAAAAATSELQAVGFGPIDYIAVRDAETLAPTERRVDGAISRPVRVLGAAWLGRTRLIDNIAARPAA